MKLKIIIIISVIAVLACTGVLLFVLLGDNGEQGGTEEPDSSLSQPPSGTGGGDSGGADSPAGEYLDVVFDSDGGSLVTAQKVKYGESAFIPRTPERDGYVFDCWLCNDKEWDFGTKITAATVLKAKWLRLVTVSFDSDGANNTPEPITVTEGKRIEKPKDPEKLGSYFMGWQIGEEIFSFDSSVYESMTLKAKWENTVDLSVYSGAYPLFFEDGKEKPLLSSIASSLDIVFENKASEDASPQLIFADTCLLTLRGSSMELVDLSDHLDKMPDFKEYLDKNPIARLSLLASTDGKEIYSLPLPYEPLTDARLIFLDKDIVERLLDDDSFSPSTESTFNMKKIKSFIPRENISVTVKGEGSERTVNKNLHLAGNILENFAMLANQEGPYQISGGLALGALKDYIDLAYGGYYGEKRSELFLGRNALWDIDELTALLITVYLNREELGLSYTAAALSVKDEGDLVALSGMLYGQRGLSDNEHMYIDENGLLIDARATIGTYKAIEYMRALYECGLVGVGNEESAAEYKNILDSGKTTPILPPLIPLSNGSGYTRMLEINETVSRYSLAISSTGVAEDENKLLRALDALNYLYSKEGQNLFSPELTESDKEKLSAAELTLPELLEGSYGITESFSFYYSCLSDEEKEKLDAVIYGLNTENVLISQGFYQDRELSALPHLHALTESEREQIQALSQITDTYCSSDGLLLRLIKGTAPSEALDDPMLYYTDTLKGERLFKIYKSVFTRMKNYLLNLS